MAYTRKTRDIYVIEQCFDGTWEEVDCEDDYKAHRHNLQEYRLMGYPTRARKKRERINK